MFPEEVSDDIGRGCLFDLQTIVPPLYELDVSFEIDDDYVGWF